MLTVFSKLIYILPEKYVWIGCTKFMGHLDPKGHRNESAHVCLLQKCTNILILCTETAVLS
jgi:hypothetical protein